MHVGARLKPSIGCWSIRQKRKASCGLKRCHWVCLLLALSFLYNPYVAAASSGGGLNVRHSVSNRATVGASELQQLAPMDSRHTHLFVDVFVVAVLGVLLQLKSHALVPVLGESLPSQRPFSSNLWFRPPPAP